MARQADNGLIFAGNTFIRNRKIPNSGFIEVGNVTSLALKSESETKERTSKQRESYGQALDSLNTPKPTTIALKCDTFDRKNFALALMGEDVDFSQTEETVTDHPVVIGKKGQWYGLGKANIDPDTVVVKSATDVDVDETAFEINSELGMILIVDASTTVQAGDSIKVSFKTLTAKGFKINAGTIDSFDLEIKVVGQNRTTGKKGTLHIPSAVVGADNEIDWFGDDFAESSLSGTAVKSGTNPTYSFTELE